LGKTRRLTEAMDVILDIESIRLELEAGRFRRQASAAARPSGNHINQWFGKRKMAEGGISRGDAVTERRTCLAHEI
jgi:hypothetical protein